jgi:hypothetical protein
MLAGDRIDTLRQPLWMERPQIVVATPIAVTVLLLDLTMLLL